MVVYAEHGKMVALADEPHEFTAPAKLFHWLVAVLIFTLFPLAWVMGDYTGILKFQLYNLHKSLGITVLALMILRAVWRWLHTPPPLPGGTPWIERWAAHLGHLGLYVLLFLMPLSGWAMVSASKFPSRFFQVYALPLIPWIADLPPEQKKPLEETLVQVHGFLSYLLLGLVVIHILAALRHGLLLKDGVMSRMFPKFAKASRTAQMTAFLGVALLMPVAGVWSAKAAEWGVKPDKSQVVFEATGSGYTATGKVGRYQSEIMFDPDAPDQTSVRLKMDMASVVTGTNDVDVTLVTPDYFDIKKFPTAEFVGKGAKPSGNGKYTLEGRLTLKGVTKPVQVPFSLSVKDGVATVKGETKINRMDFGVGPETVAGLAIDKDVKIVIDLTALRLDN